MNKLVYICFKTLALSMIFIFVWDMGFYLFRAFSLDQRMKNHMTSLQKVVMENNYIPQSTYDEYARLFGAMQTQYNNGGDFILGFRSNYRNGADYSANPSQRYTDDGGVDWGSLGLPTSLTDRNGKECLVKNTSVPASYGDIMAVMVQVQIVQSSWGWSNGNADRSGASWTNDPTQIQTGDLDGRTGMYMTYTYYVPCLHYTTVY